MAEGRDQSAEPGDEFSEKLQREVFQKYLRLRKSYERYGKLQKDLPNLVSELVRQLVKTKSARLETFASENDVISISFGREENAILAVLGQSSQVHSTLALLYYLQLCIKPQYNLLAFTHVDEHLKAKFMKFASSNHTRLCIFFLQAAPYLDGFHVILPKNADVDRSKDLLDFVSSKGHEIGAYSIREDRPTFQVIHPTERFWEDLASTVAELYGFAVSDDIWAAVNAASFVLGDFDFGISADSVHKTNHTSASY